MKSVTIERLEDCWVRNSYTFTFTDDYIDEFNKWMKRFYGEEVPEITIEEIIDYYHGKISDNLNYTVQKNGYSSELYWEFNNYINDDIWDSMCDTVDCETNEVSDYIRKVETIEI